MFRSNLGRACALSAVLLALAPACSGGDATSRPPTTAADVTSQPGGADPGVTTTTTPIHLIEVMFAGGQVAGGAQRSTVRRGERVRIRITSDVVDEVHVHTYDLKADVAPGQPAQIDLVATIPGRHEVELEKKAKQLLVLEVR
jgi:hypothetical protein